IPGCSAAALRLHCLRAYVGERCSPPDPAHPRKGRAPARPRCSRSTRSSSQLGCSHPGRVLLQGYNGQERSLRAGASLGGTSTSSSAVQQEHSFIELAGVPGCSHPGRVLLQGYNGQERSLRAGASLGGTSTSSSAVQQEHSFIEPAGVPSCSHPVRVLLQRYNGQELSLRAGPCL